MEIIPPEQLPSGHSPQTFHQTPWNISPTGQFAIQTFPLTIFPGHFISIYVPASWAGLIIIFLWFKVTFGFKKLAAVLVFVLFFLLLIKSHISCSL